MWSLSFLENTSSGRVVAVRYLSAAIAAQHSKRNTGQYLFINLFFSQHLVPTFVDYFYKFNSLLEFSIRHFFVGNFYSRLSSVLVNSEKISCKVSTFFKIQAFLK